MVPARAFREPGSWETFLSRWFPRTTGEQPAKVVSTMAWVQDHFGRVLMVRQASKEWALPGGKVDSGEPLEDGLRREVKEELGLDIAMAVPIDIYDRPQRSMLTILFRVILHEGEITLPRNNELDSYDFVSTMPKRVTSTARHFWSRAEQHFDPIPLRFPPSSPSQSNGKE